MTIFDFLRESGKSANRKLQIYMDGLRVNQSVDYFRVARNPPATRRVHWGFWAARQSRNKMPMVHRSMRAEVGQHESIEDG